MKSYWLCFYMFYLQLIVNMRYSLVPLYLPHKSWVELHEQG